MCKTRVHYWERGLSHQAFFVVLNLLDYLSTHSLMSTGGEELMPLGKLMIDFAGMPGLFLYKIAVTALVLLTLDFLKFKDTFWRLLNGVFTGIILWNTLGIAASCFYPS